MAALGIKSGRARVKEQLTAREHLQKELHPKAKEMVINQTQGPPLEPQTPPPARLTAKAAGNAPHSTGNPELEGDVMQSHRSSLTEERGFQTHCFEPNTWCMKPTERNAGNAKRALKKEPQEKSGSFLRSV